MSESTLPNSRADLAALLLIIAQEGSCMGMSPTEIESVQQDCRRAFKELHLYQNNWLKCFFRYINKENS